MKSPVLAPDIAANKILGTPILRPDHGRRLAPWLVAMLVMFAPAFLRLTAAEPQIFKFHHDNILGTSLDLVVSATDAQQAAGAETVVLDEIERLRKILSTYDPASDISKLNASSGPVPCPPELIQVLSYYDYWSAKSKGAYNGHLGELIAAWKAAEKAGALPDAATLQPIVQRLALPGWSIDPVAKTVTKLTPSRSISIRSAKVTSSLKRRWPPPHENA